jgi:hypothetical protein
VNECLEEVFEFLCSFDSGDENEDKEAQVGVFPVNLGKFVVYGFVVSFVKLGGDPAVGGLSEFFQVFCRGSVGLLSKNLEDGHERGKFVVLGFYSLSGYSDGSTFVLTDNEDLDEGVFWPVEDPEGVDVCEFFLHGFVEVLKGFDVRQFCFSIPVFGCGERLEPVLGREVFDVSVEVKGFADSVLGKFHAGKLDNFDGEVAF